MFEQHWRKKLNDVCAERLEKSLDLEQDKTIYLVAREVGKDEINKFLWIGENRPDAATVTAGMLEECAKRILSRRDPRLTKIKWRSLTPGYKSLRFKAEYAM